MKKILLTSALIIFAAGSTALAAHVFLGQRTHADTGGLKTSLEGLEPGARVSYSIISASGPAVSGHDKAGADGALVLPAHDLKAAAEAGVPVVYNLEVGEGVQNGDKPVNVMLRVDPRSGAMSVEGRGLNEFSNITLEQGSSKVETRADWSGAFRELKATGLDPEKSPEGLRLAFYGGNLMDAAPESPLVIKVAAFAQTNTRVVRNYIFGFMYMTEQLSAVMLQHASIIGTFLDAKQQLETQRQLQTLQAEAHKDYQPSDQMCRFGSFVRNIARTEVKAAHDKMALNNILMASYTNLNNGNTDKGYISEMEAKISQFRTVYCDPKDNNGGLALMCQHDPANPNITGGEAIGGTDPQRYNKDINFARTLGEPLTLGIDFTDSLVPIPPDEEDVIALAKNLYWPRSFDLAQPDESVAENYEPYQDARRYMALQNVAHNSFTSIVGLKSASLPTATPDASGPAFMKSLMREFGLSDADIDSVLGANPSYYAQMEVLAKKIYQDPDFYTNLYDKPANIDRIGVSIDAIKLMQQRDFYESRLRQEMLLSVMVQEAMDKPVRALGDQIENSIKTIR